MPRKKAEPIPAEAVETEEKTEIIPTEPEALAPPEPDAATDFSRQ